MQIPLQITFHGLEHSAAIDAAIRERAAKLEKFDHHITSCRVVVEQLARHQKHGRQFVVRVEILVPGATISVTHEHDEDARVAVKDAFDAARRKLEDHVRERRGDVKTHDQR
jgi:ribosome-associated translation inhibitor RaiA